MLNKLTAMMMVMLMGFFLSGCATTLPPPRVYGNLDPCMIVDGETICLENASETDKIDWVIEHKMPGIDDNERAALDRLKYAILGDGATTAIGLLVCSAAVEANPLGVLLIPINYFAYKSIERDLRKTSRYTTTVTPTNIITGTRLLVIINNLSVIGRCL